MVRVAAIVAVCFLAGLWAVSPGSAQSDDAFALTDPQGDVAYIVAGQQSVPAADDHGPADLLDLKITEDEDTLYFDVRVKDLEETAPDTLLDAARIDIRFRFGDIGYGVSTGTFQDSAPFAQLRRDAGGPVEVPIADLEYEADGQGRFFVHVPRDLLRDQDGAPPHRGDTFDGLHVDTHVHATGIFWFDPTTGESLQPLGMRDRMPDTEDVTYTVVAGGPRWLGDMELHTPFPYRASNGGAAELVFNATLVNAGTSEVVFDARLIDAPRAWNVSLPTPTPIAAGGNASVPIFVQTPFGHQHGGEETFTVQFTSQVDPDTVGRATFGIVYLETPQPAGHHDTLWLHAQPFPEPARTAVRPTGFQADSLWMNTLADDPEDTGADAPGTQTGIVAADAYRWDVCLRPGLLLGLDFDLDRTGEFHVRLESDATMSGTLLGTLTRVAGASSCSGQGTDLATFEGTATDLASGPTLEGPVVALSSADYVPYERDTTLRLRLDFTPDTVPAAFATAPTLNEGSSLTLPLLEYADERPAGLTGTVADAAPVPVEVAPPAEVESTPVVGPFVALAGIVAAAACRRR